MCRWYIYSKAQSLLILRWQSCWQSLWDLCVREISNCTRIHLHHWFCVFLHLTIQIMHAGCPYTSMIWCHWTNALICGSRIWEGQLCCAQSSSLILFHLNQMHEQNNKCVKGIWDAVGLTKNTLQLLHWMVSGLEMVKLLNEFDSSKEFIRLIQSNTSDITHHEQMKGV